MKVKLEEHWRSNYTYDEKDQADQVIRFEKDDEMSVKDWAEYAVKEALKGTDDYLIEVLKAEAHTGRNSRVYDAYEEGTGNMDVVIEASAETRNGFIKIMAYLSDIWQTGAIDYQHLIWFKRAIYK